MFLAYLVLIIIERIRKRKRKSTGHMIFDVGRNTYLETVYSYIYTYCGYSFSLSKLPLTSNEDILNRV